MNRRNTIQKQLVLDAVRQMGHHVTADEVCGFVRERQPSVGRGTVYRNLGILADEGEIRRIEMPSGSDCFDRNTVRHYHIRCIKCGAVFDVDMDKLPDIERHINDRHGMVFLDYDILFKGICTECQKLQGGENGK